MNWTPTREHSILCADFATGNENPYAPKNSSQQQLSDSNSSTIESVSGATEPTEEKEINNHRYDVAVHQWYCLDCRSFCTSEATCDCCALSSERWYFWEE